MDGWWAIVLGGLRVIPTITLVPRFVLSFRELYARDLRSRRGSEMDTAFGLSSRFGHSAVGSAAVFADVGGNGGIEQGEEIEMEESASSVAV